MMALIRGLRGAAPCPVCLIPQGQQSTLNRINMHPLRTKAEAQAMVKQVYPTRAVQESQLQPQGLRPIEVSSKLINIQYLILICPRMSFGVFHIVIHTKPCHGTDFMLITLDSLVTIYLMSFKKWSSHLGDRLRFKLMLSMCCNTSILVILINPQAGLM